MGFGDWIMATHDAKVACQVMPGLKCVFGSKFHNKVFWSEIFDNNPNIEKNPSPNILWIENYPGKRPYLIGRDGKQVIYDPAFRAKPGEIFFSREEKNMIPKFPFILIEPNTKIKTNDGHVSFPMGYNKDWGIEKWKALVPLLLNWIEKNNLPHKICQLQYKNMRYPVLDGVVGLKPSPTFRHALWMIAGADLIITTDGAIHHAAAALCKKAIVIWGGCTSPKILGYETHSNIWGGSGPCGTIAVCEHCKEEMKKISVEQVFEEVCKQLS